MFTPGDEPYLGRTSLLHFDKLIVPAVAQQTAIGTWTRHNRDRRTPLQIAASEIIPGSICITLAIRELVRQGYLFAAMILLRPLVERAGTPTYLVENSPWPCALAGRLAL